MVMTTINIMAIVIVAMNDRFGMPMVTMMIIMLMVVKDVVVVF